MKILLTGGTGFVGNYVAERLVEKGHTVRALVRSGSESKLRIRAKCEIAHGDVTDLQSINKAAGGCDAVIHLVGIIREFPSKGITFRRIHFESTCNVAAAAAEAGIKRFVHMSALGTRPDTPPKYWFSKWMAEEYLRSLDLDLTIFRPSVIIGPGGEFAALLKQMASAPVTPVIGNGEYLMQPVAVWNVADFFARALEESRTVGKAYEVGGPESMSYNQMLEIAGEVLGGKVRLIHFPAFPVRTASAVLDRFSFWPVTRDQLKMLFVDTVCDNSPLLEDLPADLVPYREALSRAFNE